MLDKVFGLFGTGGFGREIISFSRKHFKSNEIKFIDDNELNNNVNGFEVLSRTEFLNLPVEKKFFNVSIADNKKREEIAEFFNSNACKPIELFSSLSILNDNTFIGQGSVRCDYTIISPNVHIGKYFHANRFSQIAHDCKIGNYVTFAPQVNCNGNVHVHDYVYVGTGAIIKNGTKDRPLVIGEGSIIGMGAVITKDVEPYTTMIGNPAKKMKN